MDDLYRRVLDEHRTRRAAEPRSPEWSAVESDLEAHGIDTTDFGLFSSVAPTHFDYEAAGPVLIEWLPRVDDPTLKETIARSLIGATGSARVAADALASDFRRVPDDGTRWAYANSLAVLADASIADELLDLITDPELGSSREMLCSALKKTNDPRVPEVLIELIDDDDVSGHAISALRSYGPKRSLPYLELARAKLEAVMRRPTASDFAKRQARRALERI